MQKMQLTISKLLFHDKKKFCFRKLVIERNLLNINRTGEKSTTNSILNGGRLNSELLSPKTRKKNRKPIYTTAIQQCTGSSRQLTRQESKKGKASELEKK